MHAVLLRQGSVSGLSGGPQQDLVDGEVPGAAEDEADDLGDVVAVTSAWL